jgi:AraC-like DNA-binding protein
VNFLFQGIAEPLNVRLFSAAYARVGRWWAETDRIRDVWRLYLNEREGVSLKVGPKLHALPADRLVIVPAGLEFEAVVDSPVNQFFVQFEFVGWPAKAAQEIVPSPVILEPEPLRDALLARVIEEVKEAREIEPVLASRLKALVHLASADALAGIPEERATRFLRIAEGQQELLAVLQHIDANLDQPLSNAKLAEIAMASESRFIRRFREATGRTPGRYVQDRRLRKAAELLISTGQSIDEIAESCGFANRYYFTRVFAQRMGCPPARYRSDRPYVAQDELEKLAG